MAASARTASDDPFTQAYLEGMPASLEGTRAAERRTPRRSRTLATEAIALGGQVITPQGARKGWVRIENGTIAAVSQRKPAGATCTVTRSSTCSRPGNHRRAT
jgi:membrane-bound ClpP family serine protease